MKRILDTLFPIKLQMHIMQLENYDNKNFIKWILSHFLTRHVPFKNPLIATLKVKLLYAISGIVFALLVISSYIINGSLQAAILIALVLVSHPFILFVISHLILFPLENRQKIGIINATKTKLAKHKNTKKIAITGSYGKSSTKEILYHILNGMHAVLRTPESYNTILGISKVVDLELSKVYEMFICEMAAYKIGEIANLCLLVEPQYGILTGISKQHLTRFGGVEKVVKAKFELVDGVSDINNVVFNIDDKYILKELRSRGIKPKHTYGVSNKSARVRASDIKFDENGSSFNLIIENKRFKIQTQLFGFSNVKNILSAVTMALLLKVKPKTIVQRIKLLRQFPNRSFLTRNNRSIIIDNTYSSNPSGFEETINTAKCVLGSKVLVTPGLVELGDKEVKVHIDLGTKSRGVFDQIVLVGRTHRTNSLARGVGKSTAISYIGDQRNSYTQMVEKLSNEFDWIFLENDLTQNY